MDRKLQKPFDSGVSSTTFPHCSISSAQTTFRSDFLCCFTQEAAKGSQGKGLVDESLDISKQAAPEPGVAAPTLPSGRATGKSAGGGRRKGRR